VDVREGSRMTDEEIEDFFARKASGELTYNLIWFAESVDRTHSIVRCGMWLIDEATGALQPNVEATPASAPDLFLGVLHPEVGV
jgi:hypothetical protein